MPIFYQHKLNALTELIVWHIEESLAWFEGQVKLNSSEQERYNQIRHEEKKREFLALRICLKHLFGEQPPVYYWPNGKPYLKQPGVQSVSFSHTKGFAGVISSHKAEVGLDLEHYRPAIGKLEHRILRPEEKKPILPESRCEHLLYYWGAKECIIKITGDKSLDAQSHLRIEPFSFSSRKLLQGHLMGKGAIRNYSLIAEKVDPIYIIYGWEEIKE